jgi:methionyl-tRNA formyltransferase
MRALFLGTPATAVPSLHALSEMAEIPLVITRPDRPQGRSGKPQPPPVKAAAVERGLAVRQPETRGELLTAVDSVGSIDVALVTAFGMIIPRAALVIPRRGMVNLHFSLLPRWRGASPVAAAIRAGDDETGVSMMVMEEQLDTGPLIAVANASIGPLETGGELGPRLAHLGAQLIADWLPAWVAENVTPTAQGNHFATWSGQLQPIDRLLAMDSDPIDATRLVRSLAPRPGAVLLLDGAPHRILRIGVSSLSLGPGILADVEGEVLVGFRRGTGTIVTIQPPGRQPMDAADWWRGLRTKPSRAFS